MFLLPLFNIEFEDLARIIREKEYKRYPICERRLAKTSLFADNIITQKVLRIPIKSW